MTDRKPVINRRILHDALKPKMTPEEEERWKKIQRVEDIDFSSPDLKLTPLVKRVANDSWYKDGIHEEAFNWLASRKSQLVAEGWTRGAAKERAWLDAIWHFQVNPENYNGWRYGKVQTEIRNRVARVVDLIADAQVIGGLHPVVNWALANYHKIGKPNDEKTWLVSPADAPSAEAWNYMILAARAPKEFMALVNKELYQIQREERMLDHENERKQKKLERELKAREHRAAEQLEQAKERNKLAKQLEKKKADEALRVKQEAFELKRKEHEMAVEMQRELAKVKEMEKQAADAKARAIRTQKAAEVEQLAELREMKKEIERKFRELEKQQEKVEKEKSELREMKRKEREAKRAQRRKEELERRLQAEMEQKKKELEKQAAAEHEERMRQEQSLKERIIEQAKDQQIILDVGLPDIEPDEPEPVPDFDQILGKG